MCTSLKRPPKYIALAMITLLLSWNVWRYFFTHRTSTCLYCHIVLLFVTLPWVWIRYEVVIFFYIFWFKLEGRKKEGGGMRRNGRKEGRESPGPLRELVKGGRTLGTDEVSVIFASCSATWRPCLSRLVIFASPCICRPCRGLRPFRRRCCVCTNMFKGVLYIQEIRGGPCEQHDRSAGGKGPVYQNYSVHTHNNIVLFNKLFLICCCVIIVGLIIGV